MNPLLAGKVGLVFGIANERSYAWHIAAALRQHGARCAYQTLPNDKMIERTRDAVAALGDTDPWIEPCDAAQDRDLDAIFDRYRKSFDRLDFLIHSIAFANKDYLAPGKFVETPRDVWNQALDISAYSLIAMAQRARGLMIESGGGSILSMSYYGAEKVVPGYNVMGVAKAALECTTRYLAMDLGPHQIRVNTISGGAFRTLAAMGVSGMREILKHNEVRSPLRRNVEGPDVGGTAVWLVSDLASGVTGETIYVDCGVNTVGL
jgi:enoyl-[acyl-carrier protein] reductase I